MNVWTPATSPNDRLPVMVWIYGGGGVLGYSGDPRYDGSMVAKKGVVVVSMNYRVNVFGWLAHPELTRESAHHASGNYGSLDQLAAIQWVTRNIAGFGGDPGRITIWGQSGGSRSVNFLAASPLLKGLARAAIAQSHTSFGRMPALAEAEANGTAFMKAAGRTSLAELRAMSSEEIFDAFQKRPAGLNGAVVDGWFLPADIYTIYQQGKQNDLALMTGATNDEGGSIPVASDDVTPAEGARAGGAGRGLAAVGGGAGEPPAGRGGRGVGAPQTLAAYRAWAERTLGHRTAEFLNLYPAATDAEAQHAYHDISRDANFAGHRTWAKLQSTTGSQPAYLYLFSHVAPNPANNGNSPPPMRGAVHFSDVPFAFSNMRMWDYPWTPADWKVADAMTTYWTNFAKNLSPNGTPLPTWTVYNPKDERLLDIDDSIRMEPLSTARMDFIAAIEEANRTRARVQPAGGRSRPIR